jgi:hypothetical protein
MKINLPGVLSLGALFISGKVLAQSSPFPIVTKTGRVSIIYDDKGPKLDSIAANLLAEDIERITSVRPAVKKDISKASGNIIVIGDVQSALIQKIAGKHTNIYKSLNAKKECFGFHIVHKPLPAVSKALIIAGSDARGTAYGVFTLSEKIGISPWYWWADVSAKQQKELTIIRDQRDMLSKHLAKDAAFIPQVLTTYKEVLEVYDNGLKVPEDFTLVWRTVQLVKQK